MNFESSISLATYAHQNQFRKEGSPYVNHVLNVGDMLQSLRMPKFVVDAGYLHDSLEDSRYICEDDIINTCDIQTLKLVETVTKVKYRDKINLPKGAKGYNVDVYNQGIENDFFASMIKIADRIDNVNSIEYGDDKFRKKYIKETIDKYTEMAYRLYDVTNFDFSEYDFSVDELVIFQQSALTLADLFSMSLKSSQYVISDEIYCPITKEWIPREDAIFIGRDDGIMISKEGLYDYITNPNRYEEDICVVQISEDLDNYIDFIKENCYEEALM